MAGASSDPTNTTYHALRPRPPIRAWMLAVLLATIGAILLIFGVGRTPGLVMAVCGGVLLVLGIALGMLGIIFVNARTVHITLDAQGFQVSGPGYQRSGEWDEVTAVNATPDGARIVIACGRVSRVFIQAPGGVADATMDRIAEEISVHLAR